jgi:hypothetical protein
MCNHGDKNIRENLISFAKQKLLGNLEGQSARRFIAAFGPRHQQHGIRLDPDSRS